MPLKRIKKAKAKVKTKTNTGPGSGRTATSTQAVAASVFSILRMNGKKKISRSLFIRSTLSHINTQW